MDNLSFNREILHSFPHPFNRFIFNNSLFYFFGDILNLSFYCIVISDGPLNWDSLINDNFIIFNNLSFIWNSLDSFNSVIFNVFLLERNVFNTGFHRDLFSNSSGMTASSHCMDSSNNVTTRNIIGVCSIATIISIRNIISIGWILIGCGIGICLRSTISSSIMIGGHTSIPNIFGIGITDV